MQVRRGVEPWDAPVQPQVEGFAPPPPPDVADPGAPETCVPDDAATPPSPEPPEATLYRWTDADGTVNYADAEDVPEQVKARAVVTHGEPINVQPALRCHRLAPAQR